MDKYQSAYRSAHSTEIALVKVRINILQSIHNHKIVLFVLLDLSAAFDTVNNKYLLQILRISGIQGQALAWFESYLTDRKQNINCEGHK